MRNEFLIFILLFLYFFSSCRKDEVQIDPDSLVSHKNVFKKTEFPLAKGNVWKYVVNSFDPVKDTLVVEIIAEAVDDLGVQKFKCEISRSNYSFADYGEFQLDGNVLSYRGEIDFVSFFGNFLIQFPILENSNWIGFHSLDTVNFKEVITTPSLGNYLPALFLTRRYEVKDDNYKLIQNLGISPSIGVTYLSHYERFPNRPVRQFSLSLVDYHVE